MKPTTLSWVQETLSLTFQTGSTIPKPEDVNNITKKIWSNEMIRVRTNYYDLDRDTVLSLFIFHMGTEAMILCRVQST